MENKNTWNEHIRLRPGMYIGQVNIKGFIELLKGILSSSLSNTGSDRVTIELTGDTSSHLTFSNIQGAVKNTWTQWTPDQSNPMTIGFETLNALSRAFNIAFFDDTDSKIEEQNFVRGDLISGKKTEEINCSRIEVAFDLDVTIWGEEFMWSESYLTHQIREFAYLYKHVQFDIRYKVDQEECRIIYHFKNGLKDRIDIESLNGVGGSYFGTSIDISIGNLHIEAAFAFREYAVDEPYLISYVNDYYTHEQGSHVDALLKGLTYGVMKHFQKYELTEAYKISEKGMREHLLAALNVRMDAPVFSGCVKNKLASSEIIEPIAEYIADLLFEKMEADEASTQKLIRKFEI